MLLFIEEHILTIYNLVSCDNIIFWRSKPSGGPQIVKEINILLFYLCTRLFSLSYCLNICNWSFTLCSCNTFFVDLTKEGASNDDHFVQEHAVNFLYCLLCFLLTFSTGVYPLWLSPVSMLSESGSGVYWLLKCAVSLVDSQ